MMLSISFGLLFAVNGKCDVWWLEQCLPPHVVVEILHCHFVNGLPPANKKALELDISHWLSETQARTIGKVDYFQGTTKMK